MIVRKKTDPISAEQWDGKPHPKIRSCSCHPDQPVVSGDLAPMKKGDFILTDPSTGVSWRVGQETFYREYEIVT